jgi:hypothetical protein
MKDKELFETARRLSLKAINPGLLDDVQEIDERILEQAKNGQVHANTRVHPAYIDAMAFYYRQKGFETEITRQFRDDPNLEIRWDK